jgi:uncharacterized protein YndB with AHSA1/START domain
MPTNKDFKRLIRARMEKTGESYTTARSVLVQRSTVPQTRLPESSSAVPIREFARLAGMSDVAVKKATGCNWEKWVWALDRVGADTWSHRAIADYVHHAYKTPSWWTQMVTVGYERIKGLRTKGQQRGGGYETSKSKTIAAPASRVYRAFTDARIRRTWLPGGDITVHKSTPNRSLRMNWNDGTLVEVWLTSKGTKTSAQVQHRRLADKTDADRRREFWSQRLSALRDRMEA